LWLLAHNNHAVCGNGILTHGETLYHKSESVPASDKAIAIGAALSRIRNVLLANLEYFNWRHHLLAVAIFAAVIVAVFHRAIFLGEVLAPVDLRAIGRLLGAARALRRFLAARRAELPRLFDACSTDPTLDEVADEISGSFDADGTLADHASPRLRDLRREWQAARQRMLARMEELMNRYDTVVQDRFVTEREGRWVLPVRSDAHERFPGIVHATSGSGATLFVEPRAVIRAEVGEEAADGLGQGAGPGDP